MEITSSHPGTLIHEVSKRHGAIPAPHLYQMWDHHKHEPRVQ